MLLLTVKNKEASSAVVSITANSQLRKGDLLTPLQKSNNLDRKPLKRTLYSCDKDAEA